MNDHGWSSVPNWVIRTDRLKGTEKWVFITLLNRANAKGECWPSLATLQKDVGVSKNTILNTLRSLEEKGFISKVQRRKSGTEFDTNVYRVNVWEGGAKTELPSSNENQGVVQPLNNPGSKENQEVLPTEVLPNRSTTQGGVTAPTTPFCEHHPSGTDSPCRACKQARLSFDAEQKRAEVISLRPPKVAELFCPRHYGYPADSCDKCEEVA